MSHHPSYNKKEKFLLKRSKWYLGRRTGLFMAAAILSATALGELYIQLYGPAATSPPGWIIDGDQLQNLSGYVPSGLPKTYFNTKRTVILKNFTQSGSSIPAGWRSTAGNHYTSVSARGCGSGCSSLQADATHGLLNVTPKPVALYDDEHWARTPLAEQKNPCQAMNEFVQTAHQNGMATILAPDQDLGRPGVITTYHGGETENWQTYLRLGLGSCAAQTGTQTYHIMSQPFEAHWCGNPVGRCQSSESDFVNFVTQAALQAKAVNPDIKISDGLSTSPLYFGYFRGAESLAHVMYRDYADVRQVVNSVWLNVVGPNADTTALYFLSMLGKSQGSVRRSSVLFLQSNASLKNTQPTTKQPKQFDLSSNTTNLLFTSSQTLPGKSSLPAGTGEFQFWTDGNSSDTATVNLQFGYCNRKNCTHRTAVKDLTLRLYGNEKGAVSANGAFTTLLDTILPPGGSYHLYMRLTSEGGSFFNLLYGTTNTPTNLSTPILLPLK